MAHGKCLNDAERRTISRNERNKRQENYWSRCILLKVAWLKSILHQKFSWFKGTKIDSDEQGTTIPLLILNLLNFKGGGVKEFISSLLFKSNFSYFSPGPPVRLGRWGQTNVSFSSSSIQRLFGAWVSHPGVSIPTCQCPMSAYYQAHLCHHLNDLKEPPPSCPHTAYSVVGEIKLDHMKPRENNSMLRIRGLRLRQWKLREWR